MNASIHPRFTIAIACYQSAPYLPKSLGSVASQTFGDFEAICYVEESKDDSLEICRDFARRDPRFSVVSAPKTGSASTTRNYAIDHGKGDYVVFLDGDDWLVTDMLEKLSRKLASIGDVDVLSFAAVTTEANDINIEKFAKLSNFNPNDDADGVFSGKDAIRRVGMRNGGRFLGNTVLGIYRIAFMKEFRLYQKVGRLAEDFESTPRIWFDAERFAYLDEVLYVYRRRPGSTTTEASSRILFDLAEMELSLLEFAAGRDIPSDILGIWANQWLGMLYWMAFHPISSKKISDDDRMKALSNLVESGGRQLLKSLASRASLPKRVALPLVLLAAKGWQLPAKVFFRRLYYPLVGRRARSAQ